MGDARQGIVHVIGPQLGLTQPGMTIVCGDSHTSTHGAFGALAFGIGTSEVEHVLATQTLPLRRLKTMAVTVDGKLPAGVTRKDIILAVIAKIGTGGGQGYVIEYRGEAIRALSMEARMTVCNMSIEAGARAGMIAPDETTFDYLRGPPARADGRRLGRGGRVLATLRTDDDATFDAEVVLDAAALTPVRHVGHQSRVRACRSVRAFPTRDDRRRRRTRQRRTSAGVHGPAGRHAAARHRGRHRVPRLVHQRSHRGPACGGRGAARAARSPTRCGCSSCRARCAVKAQAEAEGLDEIFTAAGAEWRQRRLLDVPRHEPRPARAGRAVRVDVEPQLRRPPGQGRPHASGVAAGRRGHRGDRAPVRAGRSRLTTDPRATTHLVGRFLMDKFTTHTGRGVPLRRSNVDTDQIIPAVYLKRVTRTGFEDGLFAAWRADPTSS